MKLYASPFACSFTVRVALAEAGLAADVVWVDLKTKQAQDGSDLRTLNPKGQVPTLVLDDRAVLTEVGAILQYVGDRVPGLPLVPPPASFERYRLQEWLSFIAGEVHKTLGVLLITGPAFDPTGADATRRLAQHLLPPRLDHIARTLDRGSFLMGEYFTVADAYLFNMLIWARYAEVDLTPWPGIGAYSARLAARPAIAPVLAEERDVRFAGQRP
ncbi:MAG TPA: glutathione S-transferase N-terminal domain-containing protein [Aliidongia sp.]|uniref:glutathione S-transferase N-terminal domain-containing protein n=1 Tax=Aliidongia sp. TaxID=1914230 RepID=UPI002DDDB1ED|nr:glutathione S-transferase N-terminal domain-containing protein [Aliidongia sp.]HEV2678241.1 glutathione S-transferase N-terminal domain-containing protein [Aliidongia sp.]